MGGHLVDSWDERALRPAAELVGSLADFISQVGGPDQGMALTVQDLRVALPVELVVETGEDGALAVMAATPERTGTSFAPTLGTLSLRVVLDDA